jgi:hypothetical protein
MSEQKLQKFVRSSATTGQLRIQPRDVALIRDIASFYFLNTAQILALHPGSRRNLQKRLSMLFHLGYVERPLSQKENALPSDFLVYSLGKKGAFLAFADKRDIKTWAKRNAKISSPNLAHALMVSQFRTVLTLGLQKRGGIISRWLQGYDLKDELTLKSRTPDIVPDAFFTVKLKDKQWHFFLEADRSTMSHHRFLAKMRAYWRWFAEKTYNAQLKIENFRVLTIANAEGRRDNLQTTAKDADPKRSGSGLFLFACEKDYSLQNPEAVLSSIWLSAKDNNKHSLFE